MVELACSSHGRSICQLWHGFHDAGRRFDPEPSIRPPELPGLPVDGAHHVDPILHQQHADRVDCQLQFIRIELQHCRLDRCYHHDSGGDNQGRSRPAQIYSLERCLGKFLRRHKFSQWGFIAHVIRRRLLDNEVNPLPFPFKGFALTATQWIRRPFSLERGMFKRKHRFTSSHCPNKRRRWYLRMVPPTRSRLHRCRHRRRPRVRSRSTVRRLLATSLIAKSHSSHTRTDDHLRLFNGPRLHGESPRRPPGHRNNTE